jgi:hypothetical protein
MGRPADSYATADDSLTVRDNRTGKTYIIPYVAPIVAPPWRGTGKAELD